MRCILMPFQQYGGNCRTPTTYSSCRICTLCTNTENLDTEDKNAQTVQNEDELEYIYI